MTCVTDNLCRRVECGLLQDPTDDSSDEELVSLISEIREDAPYSGVQIIWGKLRVRGVKVTRDHVRSLLRLIDRLG